MYIYLYLSIKRDICVSIERYLNVDYIDRYTHTHIGILGHIVGVVPGHCSKVNIRIK